MEDTPKQEDTESMIVSAVEADPIAFSNDLILDGIFQYLSTPDLLTCGLVNKKWNWNSRVYLQEKRNSLAKVQDCQQLKELNDMLTQSHLPLPFNGLFISGGHQCADASHPEDFYEYLCEDLAIFTRMKLRLMGHTGLDCPAIQFIKRYFQDGSPLEQLEIITLPSKINSLQEMFQGLELNMKSLTSVTFPIRKYDGLVNEVISVASNLQKIFGPIAEDEVEIIRQNKKIQALKDFLLEPEGIPQMETCGQLVLEQPRLRFMKVSSGWYRSNGDNMPVLKKLRHISSIEIIATAAPRHTTNYITSDFRMNLEEFTCHSVRKLRLTKIDFPTEQTWFDWMKELFPNLREFQINVGEKVASYLTSTWTTWPELEQVTVTELGGQNGKKNLDAALCGISEEELQELKTKDETFLRNYQYASTKPGLQNLLCLRRLVLEAQHCKDLARKENTQFLTQLTGHLVLERVRGRNFTVKVIRKECQNSCKPCVFLDHISPFVNFVDK
ncbi:unnamed protein product [Allacma fusca]|uniref:F-box domain-containing protein n=1 Tax=Allacma fusca TaxID=39272 RepID=A0A8J2J764_9HEXA|nr:unnamed protein product [Allacma fusca]